MVVATLIGVAAFVAAIIATWLGSFVALHPLRKTMPDSWVERARLAYPARIAAAASAVILPLVFCGLIAMVAERLEIEIRVWYYVVVAFAAYAGGLIITGYTEQRLRGSQFEWRFWLAGLTKQNLMLALYLGTTLVAIYLMPYRLNWQAIRLLVPSVLILSFATCGGVFTIMRWLGMIYPASPRLTAIVREVSARTGIRVRGVYEMKSNTANAMAIIVPKYVLFTNQALDLLNDAQVATVCAHELSHLNEPRTVTALRIASSLSPFLVAILATPVIGEFGPSGLLAMILIMLIARIAARRVARKMEVRADIAGRAQQTEDGSYAIALERLYEANLAPVVTTGRRRVHPHLYDRLVSAGLTPSYQRPSPPSRNMMRSAMLVTVLVGIVLFGSVTWGVLNWLGSS